MIRVLATSAAIAFVTPSLALTLDECKRTTHPSHGGEAAHRDLGEGLVGYVEWWSQEGVFTDVVIANCYSGEYLRTRLREERMTDRPAFDRIQAGLNIIETELGGAPSLFSFQRLAGALDRVGRDIEIAKLKTEPCACAAAYPGLLGQKEPYQRDK